MDRVILTTYALKGYITHAEARRVIFLDPEQEVLAIRRHTNPA